MANVIKRQAVVIIHGMGEQRPMDTLRAFVVGVKKYLEKTDTTELKTKMRSSPDSISATYETRRLNLSASRNRPSTDFYEFYWAHNMRDTEFSHTFTWLYKLIVAKPSGVPRGLKMVWLSVWLVVLIILATTVVIMSVIDYNKIQVAIAGLAAIPLLATILALLQKIFGNIFLSTVGDAARYFTPIPSNIEQRNNIRRQGIDFLDELHKEDNKYDRVIVVAHSLGSAVGYDLLRLLWIKHNKIYKDNAVVDQSLLKQQDKFWNVTNTTADVASYQVLQYRTWLQQRATGNKWLITDFITLGAAISNADFLMVNKRYFPDLIADREFPICPPVMDERGSISYTSNPYNVNIEGKLQKRTVRILHHAALFAVVRWTNIFFRTDFVGGSACRLFGKGIRDVSIDRKSLWFLPGGHTNYWDDDESVSAIVNALRLREDQNPNLKQNKTKMS